VLLVQFSDQFVLPKLFDRFWLLQSVGVDFAQIAGSFRFLARSERQEKTKKAKLRWRSDHRSGIRLDRCSLDPIAKQTGKKNKNRPPPHARSREPRAPKDGGGLASSAPTRDRPLSLGCSLLLGRRDRPLLLGRAIAPCCWAGAIAPCCWAA
jgi:hypothetical protein